MPKAKLLTVAQIMKLKPCWERVRVKNMFADHASRAEITIAEFAACKDVEIYHRVWVIDRLFTQRDRSFMYAWCINRFMKDHCEATPHKNRALCRRAIKVLKDHGRGKKNGQDFVRLRRLTGAATQSCESDAIDIAHAGLCRSDDPIGGALEAALYSANDIDLIEGQLAPYIDRAVKHLSGRYPLR